MQVYYKCIHSIHYVLLTRCLLVKYAICLSFFIWYMDILCMKCVSNATGCATAGAFSQHDNMFFLCCKYRESRFLLL